MGSNKRGWRGWSLKEFSGFGLVKNPGSNLLNQQHSLFKFVALRLPFSLLLQHLLLCLSLSYRWSCWWSSSDVEFQSHVPGGKYDVIIVDSSRRLASVSREHMSCSYDALKTYVPQMVELLIDSARNPAFLDWEVSEQLQKMNAEVTVYSKNPQHLLLEAIHSAGYSGPYANSLLASESAVNILNSTVLEEFVAENYIASRIILAASGVDHDELLKYAEPLISDLPNVPRPAEPKPVYTGGDFHHQDDTFCFCL